MKRLVKASLIALMFSGASAIAAPLVGDPSDPANPTAAAAAQTQATLSAPDPRDSVLNRANEKLLIENAELRQQLGKLEVQVQVLQESQSTELFTRGSWMTLLAVLVGFIAAMFLIKRKSEW